MSQLAPSRSTEDRGTLPLATLLVGCGAFSLIPSFPWLPLIVGLIAVGLAFASRGRITGPRAAAQVAIGTTLGVAAIVLFWMAPGLHTIIWG